MKCYFFIGLITLTAAVFFVGCSEDRAPTEYQTHPEGWTDQTSAAFHGRATIGTYSGWQACRDCHELRDFNAGGMTFCWQCHAAYPHNIQSGVPPVQHQAVIAAQNWQLGQCAGCHGVDWAGGRSGVGCNQCHRGALALNTCTVCHGNPPVDDGGLPYSMAAGGAGAHYIHAVKKRYACTECHANVTDLTHADALPAEVTFANAGLARHAPFSNPVYYHSGAPNSGNGSCGSNYCHSDGDGGPPRRVAEWVGGNLVCGDCHLIPPPSPHPPNPTCHLCHGNVDPGSDYSHPDSIKFIFDLQHVDGFVNFR